jgi:hypothetical protein
MKKKKNGPMFVPLGKSNVFLSLLPAPIIIAIAQVGDVEKTSRGMTHFFFLFLSHPAPGHRGLTIALIRGRWGLNKNGREKG